MDLALQIKLFIIAKALVEIAAVALIGRGIVALFAGANRDQNVIYVLFRIVTQPAIKVARFLTPVRLVRETHLPVVAFFLCFWLWVMILLAIAYTCGQAGLGIAECTGKSA
jgi:hypothetical protein